MQKNLFLYDSKVNRYSQVADAIRYSMNKTKQYGDCIIVLYDPYGDKFYNEYALYNANDDTFIFENDWDEGQKAIILYGYVLLYKLDPAKDNSFVRLY